MPPLTAGAMTSRFTLQSVSEVCDPAGTIVPTWSTIATVWGERKAAGNAAPELQSEQSSPRIAFDVRIRRRALTLPIRLLDTKHGNAVCFALDQENEDTFRDATLLRCVDGVSFARAETVTVYRGTDARQSDGSTKRTWASFATGVQLLVDDADAEYLYRTFGVEVDAELRATADIGTDVRLGDGVTVTAGRHIGQRFLVKARRIDPTLPAQAYWAIALKRTTEAFT